MKKIAHFAVAHRRALILVFALLTAASAVCIPFVSMNYDDTVYLPESSNTKLGLKRMQEAFSGGGSAICMLKSGDMATIMEAKRALLGVEGVHGALWLDDILLPMISSARQIPESEALSIVMRSIQALEAKAEETPGGVLTRFQQALSPEDMQVALTIFQTADIAGFDIPLSGGLSALSAPLGEGYAASVSSLQAQLDAFFRDDCALFQLSFTNGDYDKQTSRALEQIEKLPYEFILTGNAATTFDSQRNITREVIIGSIAAGVVVLFILTLFSSAWIEPLIYIIVIGASVALNMGSNLLLGQVSYLTNSIACILQMVLSIDYAIFLLSRYKRERAGGLAPEEAMAEAFARSLSPISASSLTTIACFITIMFMRFGMGLDMGLVLAKGILCSLLGVFLLLPGLVMRFDGALLKTGHKSFRMEGAGLSRVVYKYRVLILIITVLVAAPAVYFSNLNAFIYGASATQGEDSLATINRAQIESVFGRQELLAILVPETDDAREADLARALTQFDTGILRVEAHALIEEGGYADMLPDAMLEQLDGDGWWRVILYLDAEEEGPETRELIARIREAIRGAYGADAEYYLLGNTAAALDMEECTRDDYTRISWFSLIAVAAIVALSFKSPLIAVVLVLVIEAGIRINMAIPYLRGEHMAFIGYMIIVNILLGSTIDYAILITTHYFEARETRDIPASVAYTHAHSLRALLTSAGIFALGGAVVSIFMSSETVRMIGRAILRGGVCAFTLTVLTLPALLAVFDKWLMKSVIHIRLKRARKTDS